MNTKIGNKILSNLREDKETLDSKFNQVIILLSEIQKEINNEDINTKLSNIIVDIFNIQSDVYNDSKLIESNSEYKDETIYESTIYNKNKLNESDEDFKRYVDSMLRDGAIDDPEYVKSLSDEEYEDLLVNTWMKDPEIIEMYNDSKKHNALFKIYQLKNIENCPYAFMNYDKAKDKINLNDYDEVATIELYGTDEDLLEKVFEIGNTDKSKFNIIKPMRSISVSDIIDMDDEKYYVDSFGFKKLEDISE